jgi:cytoskeletal protein RodZ
MNIKNLENNEVNDEIESLSIGEFFKKKREESNLEISKVATFLKVRINDIKSLENNDIDKIAKNIYIVGLIKSYARFLKINNNIIDKKISDLSIRSNTENKKHILLNIGDDNELSPSLDLVFNSMVAGLIIFLTFMMIFSSIENNANLINTDNIISDIVKLKD